MNAKAKVLKLYPNAKAHRPNPRGMHYGQWTIALPPTVGIFGLMQRVLGYGDTANKAWANAADSQEPAPHD